MNNLQHQQTISYLVNPENSQATCQQPTNLEGTNKLPTIYDKLTDELFINLLTTYQQTTDQLLRTYSSINNLPMSFRQPVRVTPALPKTSYQKATTENLYQQATKNY